MCWNLTAANHTTICRNYFSLTAEIGSLIDMRIASLKSCSLVFLLIFNMQSLVDVARDEAKRRKQLEEQGIEARIIDGNTAGLARQGNITTSTEPAAAVQMPSVRPDSLKSRGSVRSYRSALQKLDRAIQQNEAHLTAKRARMQTEKWANLISGKASKGTGPKNPQSRLQAEIDALEIKLKQLRDERFEAYEEGKRAGFLPGELEGKALIP
jgi:hypothetical protein